jgi:hypothetical protein
MLKAVRGLWFRNENAEVLAALGVRVSRAKICLANVGVTV